MRSLLLYLTCLLAFALPASAQEYTFGTVGNTSGVVNIDYGSSDGVYIPGLTASMTYTLISISVVGDNNEWKFSGSVTNTSSGDITASTISAFGFNIDAAVELATATGVYFDTTNLTANISNATWLDVCVYGSGSCAGGGGGVTLGNSSAFTLILTIDDEVTSIMLSDLTVRYQAIAGTEYSGSGSAIGTVSVIPEPATWLMMIIGFGIVSASARRSKRHTSVARA